MHNDAKNMLLFSGSSHPILAQEIGKFLGIPLGKVDIKRFPDGEIEVQILENVRTRDVFVVQSVALDPNNYLMELLIIIDALKRASAQSIIAVIPYFGYCRQDRRDKPRVPITAKLVANLLMTAGATRVLTMDLHAGQLQGFFDIPVDNLFARPAFLKPLKQMGLRDLVVVTPDIGSIKLARSFATELGVDFAIVDKHRSTATQVEAITLIGDVKGKDVLLADDMCSTGGTLVSAAHACQEKGARRIIAVFTHGLLVGPSVEKLQKSPIEKLLMSNTIQPTERLRGSSKIQTVSVAPIFGHAFRCIVLGESITSLYEDHELEFI